MKNKISEVQEAVQELRSQIDYADFGWETDRQAVLRSVDALQKSVSDIESFCNLRETMLRETIYY